MNMEYSHKDVINWIEELKSGKIKPDHMVPGQFGDITLLQAVLITKIDTKSKYEVIKKLIDLGCNVDQFGCGSTAISQAVISNSNQDNYKNIVLLMLQHHEKGHFSDFNILKSCTISFDDSMFEFVINSKKIDVNITRSKGTHILHVLAEDQYSAGKIHTLFKIAPDTIPNPINRKGLSPLAIAINKTNTDGALSLWRNKETKIIGKIENPSFVVFHELIDRYDGNFFVDFPNMTEYTISIGKENLLPKEIEIFLF